MKNFIKVLLAVLVPATLLCTAIMLDPKTASAQYSQAITPHIYNVTLTNAGTEYSQALPNGTGAFTIKSRTVAAFQLAFVSSGSGTTYFTVPANQSYYESNVSTSGTTLYMQSANAGQVVEIVYWTNP